MEGELEGRAGHTGGSFLINLFMAPLRVGLSGLEPVSLISDMLVLSRRALPLLERPLWLNLTSFRGRAMAVQACFGCRGCNARMGRDDDFKCEVARW